MSGYFKLGKEALKAEIRRRGLNLDGNKQELQVRLVEDDKLHCNIAKQTIPIPFHERERHAAAVSSNVGDWQDPANLVNECVLHWSLNDDGCNLKLYFESGQMVNIEGDWGLRHGKVALDGNLCHALQALTGCNNSSEQQGTNPNVPLRITEASLARRVSVVAKCAVDDKWKCAWEETHIVVGLRLEGMWEMGYIYAYDPEDDPDSRPFADVSVGALQMGTYKKD